jgi:hypothetical protein
MYDREKISLIGGPEASVPITLRVARWIIVTLIAGGWLAPWFSTGLADPQVGSATNTKKSRPQAGFDLEKLQTLDLIEKLQEESNQEDNSPSARWVSGFMVIDGAPAIPEGIPDPNKPWVSPIMRELVRRGTAALPVLIDHLDDDRPTKLFVIHKSVSGGMWQSDEYVPRHVDSRNHPPGINTGRHLPGTNRGLRRIEGFDLTQPFEIRYTVRVGDLCYIAFGQIVNRSFSFVRYQPTDCIVINSPVHTPALVAAVKQDWSGLTVGGHKLSLSQDALVKYPYDVSAPAVVRLLFYYPNDGESVALKLLARPIYSTPVVLDFIQRLVQEDNSAKWKAMIEKFRFEHGQASADAIPFRLHWVYWMAKNMRNRDFMEGNNRAFKILTQFYPDYRLDTPTFVNAADPQEQHELIARLARSSSEKIDQAVYRVYQSISANARSDDRQNQELDFLAFDCMSRLLEKGHGQEFRAYVLSRIRDVEALPEKSEGRRSLDSLRNWDRRLKGQK